MTSLSFVIRFLEHKLEPRESILCVNKCSHITPFHKRDGEILVGTNNAYFIDSHQFHDKAEKRRKITSERKHLMWPYEEIKAIHKKRYLLKDTAMEIFLLNGETHLLAFEKENERNLIFNKVFFCHEVFRFLFLTEKIFVREILFKISQRIQIPMCSLFCCYYYDYHFQCSCWK
jgi:hypothetical protein